jgi:spore maturation protein SpmB
MIHLKLGARKLENYLFQGLTNTYIHSTKIMNTLLIVALGKAENLTSVINVDMFGTIGMEQISLSLDNHIVVVVICYVHSAT